MVNTVENTAATEDLLRAYGPEKEAWKAAGNYFTAEELERMAEDFKDLVIKHPTKRVYAAD